jgi:YegS/Rv2252/BmrU family lipid kinase
MSRLLAIVNPAAGRGRVRRAWLQVADALLFAGVDFDVAQTVAPLDATSIAQGAAGRYAAVIAVGGDGTVHEVVNGLMRVAAEARPALGVLPLGSGDDFAKTIALAGPGARRPSWQGALAAIARGEARAHDVGVIRDGAGGERWFANCMDVGFGAHVARNIAAVPRWLTGPGAYLAAIACTMVRYPLLELRLQVDDQPAFTQRSNLAAVMNGRCFGGSFWACPEALADDGLLDVLLADVVTRAQILRLVPKLMRGRHTGEPVLRMLRARSVVIESEAPLVVEADGELPPLRGRRLEIGVAPGALRVLA